LPSIASPLSGIFLLTTAGGSCGILGICVCFVILIFLAFLFTDYLFLGVHVQQGHSKSSVIRKNAHKNLLSNA
jgi:hypothetical protein